MVSLSAAKGQWGSLVTLFCHGPNDMSLDSSPTVPPNCVMIFVLQRQNACKNPPPPPSRWYLQVWCVAPSSSQLDRLISNMYINRRRIPVEFAPRVASSMHARCGIPFSARQFRVRVLRRAKTMRERATERVEKHSVSYSLPATAREGLTAYRPRTTSLNRGVGTNRISELYGVSGWSIWNCGTLVGLCETIWDTWDCIWDTWDYMWDTYDYKGTDMWEYK